MKTWLEDDFLSIDPEDFLGACKSLLDLDSAFLTLVIVCLLVCEFLGEVAVGLLDHLIVSKENLVLLALLPVQCIY